MRIKLCHGLQKKYERLSEGKRFFTAMGILSPMIFVGTILDVVPSPMSSYIVIPICFYGIFLAIARLSFIGELHIGRTMRELSRKK